MGKSRPTPPTARRAKRGSIVGPELVRHTAASKSARAFLVERLAKAPVPEYPATNAGAVRYALERVAGQLGWTPPEEGPQRAASEGANRSTRAKRPEGDGR